MTRRATSIAYFVVTSTAQPGIDPWDSSGGIRWDGTVEELGVDDVGVRGSLPLVSAWVGSGGQLAGERLHRLLAEVAGLRSALARALLRHIPGRAPRPAP